jgi:hypothetical protein
VRDLDVVVVSDHSDEHCVAVLEELNSIEASSLVFNLGDLRRVFLSAPVGALDVLDSGDWARASRNTTVWWRRAGAIDATGLDSEEAALLTDEGPDVLRGALLAAGVRWVDDANSIERAELKLFQLATAARLGVRIPITRIMNSPEDAHQFANGRRLVAKALSSGIGIAPFAAELTADDLDKVAGCPTMLQELVEAEADLRIVVVNDQAWVWRRSRSSAVDWRSEDPEGRGFQQVEMPGAGDLAVKMTSALGLTMGVHDWLETNDGPVFLEVNPQGQWLFLNGAREMVAPAVARHLFSAPETPGTWPRAIVRFCWDFLPGTRAPANDGVVAPTFVTPVWVNEVATQRGALDAARRAHDEAKHGAQVAEDKASRLVQIALALLTIGLALGAFQLSFVLDHDWPWALSMIPIGVGLACLILAAFEAVEVDRVGMYHHPSPADLSGTENAEATLIAGEELGRRLARWTSDRKHTDLMQARAWFSRALAALVVGAVLAGIAHATSNDPTKPKSSTSQPTSLFSRRR